MNETPIYDHLAAKFGVRRGLFDAIAAASIDNVIASFDLLLTWAATEGDQS